MFLSTRDPSVEFPADLNSRVTMVNFSVSNSRTSNEAALLTDLDTL